MARRCDGCGRYLDRLTPEAEPHPIAENLCVGCGVEWQREDGWSKSDQQLREGLLYPEACR